MSAILPRDFCYLLDRATEKIGQSGVWPDNHQNVASDVA